MTGGNYFPGEQFIVFGPIFGFQASLRANGRFITSSRRDAMAIVSHILGELSDGSKMQANRFLDGAFENDHLWIGIPFYRKDNDYVSCRICIASPTPEYIK